MRKVTIKLPEPLRSNIAALAQASGHSVEYFVATAAAEKMAAIHTLAHLRQEAALGRREDFEHYLTDVPDQNPLDSDAG